MIALAFLGLSIFCLLVGFVVGAEILPDRRRQWISRGLDLAKDTQEPCQRCERLSRLRAIRGGR